MTLGEEIAGMAAGLEAASDQADIVIAGNAKGFVVRVVDVANDCFIWVYGSIRLRGDHEIFKQFWLGKDDVLIDWKSLKKELGEWHRLKAIARHARPPLSKGYLAGYLAASPGHHSFDGESGTCTNDDRCEELKRVKP